MIKLSEYLLERLNESKVDELEKKLKDRKSVV